MGLHVVIVGSPADGFRIVGVFKTFGDAISWAGKHVSGDGWWPMPLEAPESWETE